MIQNSKPKSQVFHVAGVSSHGESLKKLAKLNPDWNLSPEDIVAGGKAGQKIFRLKFITRPVELRKNRESGTLDVYVADQILGYIHPSEVDSVKKILKNCEVQNIACGIWGGQCKVVDEFYDIETEQAPLTVNLKIVYTDPAPIEDDFNDLIFDDPAPAISTAAPARSRDREEKPAKPSKQKAKKPIFKRWWFWAFVLVSVIALLFGGNDDGNATEAPSSSGNSSIVADVKNDSPKPEVPRATEAPAAPLEASGTLGNYAVQIHDCEFTTDYLGNPAILIDFSFTNNSEENVSATVALQYMGFQNGVQLEYAYFTDEAIYNSDDLSKDVQPGASIDLTVAYSLTSDTAPVEFEVSELFSFDNKMLGKTYVVAEGGTTVLSVAPSGTISGEINDCTVSIISYKLVKDYEGKDAILFELGFTNNNNDTYNYMSAVNFTPFQDGIELETAILMEENDYIGHSILSVKPGAGITVAEAFILSSSTSPVEIEISDPWGFSSKKIETTIDIS